MESLVPAPNTSSWFQTQYGCLLSDPTLIARKHTFADRIIPSGIPLDPAAGTKICGTTYRTAWAFDVRSDMDQERMVLTEMDHPQFAYRATVGGPATLRQIDVESQLRRLDRPLTSGDCQAILPPDAPLFRNTVAPLPPTTPLPLGVQNAANPLVALVKPANPENNCREQADRIAVSLSNRPFNNTTRQDTARMKQPFSPPGIGRV